ncbi:MAG TPA: hypothetical protein VIH38_08945, partial [Steroidobacteraceae bacterium]
FTGGARAPRRRGAASGVAVAPPYSWLDGNLVTWYHRLMKEVTRTQTGVRLESRLLKVLKALATELDLSLGDLLEGIVLHAFEGKAPFSAATLKKVKALKAVYGLDLTARDSHQLREAGADAP